MKGMIIRQGNGCRQGLGTKQMKPKESQATLLLYLS